MSIRESFKNTTKEFDVGSMGKKYKFVKMNGLQLANLFDWQRSVSSDEAAKSKNDLYWKARVIAASLVNEDSSFVFSQSQEDLDELVQIDADTFAELYVIAGRLIGFVLPESEGKDTEVAKEPKN